MHLNWGSVPDWIATIAAIVAGFFAYKAVKSTNDGLKIENKRDKIQDYEKKIDQASKISFFPGFFGRTRNNLTEVEANILAQIVINNSASFQSLEDNKLKEYNEVIPPEYGVENYSRNWIYVGILNASESSIRDVKIIVKYRDFSTNKECLEGCNQKNNKHDLEELQDLICKNNIPDHDFKTKEISIHYVLPGTYGVFLYYFVGIKQDGNHYGNYRLDDHKKSKVINYSYPVNLKEINIQGFDGSRFWIDQVMFTDAKGVRWIRETNGNMKEATKNYN